MVEEQQSPLPSNDISHDTPADHEQTQKSSPFLFRVRNDLVPSFAHLVGKYSLRGVLVYMDALANREESRGRPYSGLDAELIQQIENVTLDLEAKGIDLEKIPLAFRYVSGDEKLTVDKILEYATAHGGKAPDDPSLGVCVDSRGKVDDFVINGTLKQRKPGVVFVYDESKMRPLTPEEEGGELSKFAAGYGMAPIDGLKLTDVLVGMVALDMEEED